MYENGIEIMNVAGPQASGDPEIYKKAYDIIKGVYWTDRIKAQNKDSQMPGKAPGKPKTVDEAVDQILVEFPLRDKIETANLTEEDLAILQAVLAEYIGDKLNEWSVSKELYADCLKKSDDGLLDKADAATVTLRVLWDRLQESHRLRVVK